MNRIVWHYVNFSRITKFACDWQFSLVRLQFNLDNYLILTMPSATIKGSNRIEL